MKATTTKTIQLICSLLLGEREPSVTTYTPSKTALLHRSTPYFKRANPATLGISPERITAFLCELETDTRLCVHSVMILKDGKVISEAYAPGFADGIPHLSHSMSKTVTAIAAAILADEEKLDTDTTLAEIFTDISMPKAAGEITVGDLLIMASGLDFSEFGAITSDAWTPDLLSSYGKFTHGEGFHYNSMNSYLLARIIERLSGESFGDFVHSRLFAPLKIENYLWEKGPEGTEKGGWGLYLAPEDWLKIATLFITGGKFENKTVVSSLSMFEVLFKRNDYSRDNNGDFDYAGHVNMHKTSSNLLLNGLFGQDVYVDPSNHLAVVVMSGSPELFKKGGTVSTILKYFPPELDDKRTGFADTHKKTRALKAVQGQFFTSRAFVKEAKKKRSMLAFVLGKTKREERKKREEWDAIIGKYTLPKNNLSPLPIIQRVMENNLRGGIDELEILEAEGGILLRFISPYETYKIRAGIERYEENELSINGELYRVRAIAGAYTEEGITLYKVAFIFPELPNARYLVARKSANDVIELLLTETPNDDAFLPFLNDAVSKSTFASIAISMIEKKLGGGFIERKIRELFSPTLIAPVSGSSIENEILKSENARIEKERTEILSIPFISSFIKKKSQSDTPDSKPITKQSDFFGFLSSLFGGAKDKNPAEELLT